MYTGEYDIPHNNSSSSCHSRMKTSASLSDIYYSPEDITSNQQPRRQTIQE
jgi:hypothetical protein